ncbi:MAG: ATP-grasp domain-containing protein [Ignavibacteria bacterium]|jgi:D-alanine-D-alanine ligase
MKVGITFNIKKEIEAEVSKTSRDNQLQKYFDDNLVKNYSERLSDKYAEWDDRETIDAIRSALEKAGHKVVLIEADENAYQRLRNERPDIVFNLAEGYGGPARESYLPTILELLNIPYTASDPVTIGICHDKSRCKEILTYYNIPTPNFFITDSRINGQYKINFPGFVKPLHEGSSKGIYNTCIVHSKDELNREVDRIWKDYCQPSIIEDFLEGREFTVAMLGNGSDTRVLPIVEINLDCVPEGFNKIYSYEVKWFFDTRENKLDIFTCPAKISPKLKKNIEDICLQAYKVLRIKDWARIDIRCDSHENPYIIEVNPLPGILPNPDDNSCFPKAARAAGIEYDNLINTVLNLAIQRYKIK